MPAPPSARGVVAASRSMMLTRGRDPALTLTPMPPVAPTYARYAPRPYASSLQPISTIAETALLISTAPIGFPSGRRRLTEAHRRRTRR
jgi:hypothetical protein